MIPEWGLLCKFWKQENQADLANHSNGVFQDQPLRRPLTPGCAAFAKNSAPLSLNSSSPHPHFCGLDLVHSLCGYAGIIWFIPLCFHCLVCSLTLCFSTAMLEVHYFFCYCAAKCHLEQTCLPHIICTSQILPKWGFAKQVRVCKESSMGTCRQKSTPELQQGCYRKGDTWQGGLDYA